MSFSNTSVDNPDPYKAKNLENPDLSDKVEDLIAFVEKCKFCMMGTRTSDGLIVSRCMALAGKVCSKQTPLFSVKPAIRRLLWQS